MITLQVTNNLSIQLKFLRSVKKSITFYNIVNKIQDLFKQPSFNIIIIYTAITRHKKDIWNNAVMRLSFCWMTLFFNYLHFIKNRPITFY